jgi:hypothetical protein
MKDPLKRYRRRFRSWKNAVRLKGELEGYEAAFASRGLAIPDDSATRLALKNRFPGFRPKPKGALSIIAVYHHYNWKDGALKPALEKFGTVRRYDWFKAFDHSLPGLAELREGGDEPGARSPYRAMGCRGTPRRPWE